MIQIAEVITNHLKVYRPILLASRAIRSIEDSTRALYGMKGRVVRLEPKTAQIGNVLVSHVLDPFLRKPGESISHSHSKHWESWQIAQTFLNLGYAVDVIHDFNFTLLPKREYSVLVDTRWNL
jgi:hypothetical protein